MATCELLHILKGLYFVSVPDPDSRSQGENEQAFEKDSQGLTQNADRNDSKLTQLAFLLYYTERFNVLCPRQI